MAFTRIAPLLLFFLLLSAAHAQTPQPDWRSIEEETMRHFQAILRLDTQNPPGNATARTAIRSACWKKPFTNLCAFDIVVNLAKAR